MLHFEKILSYYPVRAFEVKTCLCRPVVSVLIIYELRSVICPDDTDFEPHLLLRALQELPCFAAALLLYDF